MSPAPSSLKGRSNQFCSGRIILRLSASWSEKQSNGYGYEKRPHPTEVPDKVSLPVVLAGELKKAEASCHHPNTSGEHYDLIDVCQGVFGSFKPHIHLGESDDFSFPADTT